MLGLPEQQEETSYRILFEGSPVAIWDEDFSAVKTYLDTLRRAGISDLRTHFSENPTAVLECIRRVHVRHVNRQAREFYGAATEEELILSLPSLFDESSERTFIDEIVTFYEGQNTFEAELLARTLTGESRLVQMNVSLVATPADDWSRVIVTFTDLTERRRLEESLRRANEVLRRLNEDLEQFAYAAAHDLREPLRTIALYTQVLHRLHAEQLGEPAQAALTYILNGTKRMETLVDDLLSFAYAMESPVLTDGQSVNPAILLQEALADLGNAIQESGCRIEVGDLDFVCVQPSHLRQIFQNLVGNAIKYRHPERTPSIRISSEVVGSETHFCVEDNGIGIRPEYHVRIFGIFKRLHGEQLKGNGIGLALCKKLVEHYCGQIWVESNEGEGSRFFFTIPHTR